MGLTARVYLVNNARLKKDRITHWVNNHFKLEKFLIAALIVFTIGLIIDTKILFEWLKSTGPMEKSVHHAFIASGLIVGSIHIAFSSFLLDMFKKESTKSG